jgi:hypothetical protein
MARRIENDEAYEKSLSWLVKKAVELEDPLLDPAEKNELQRKYDFVADAVGRYRRGQLVLIFPGLRAIYAQLGWSYDDFAPAPPEPEQVPEKKPEPQPPQQPDQAKKAALASWLDDDDE